MRLIKKTIPVRYLVKIRNYRDSILRLVFKIFSTSQFASSLYYNFFSSAFRREHQGVIFGRLKYIEELENTLKTSYLLRRNIHMLEKGLLMRPRRDIFALDYIEATVSCYKKCSLEEKGELDEKEMQWAHDVLTEYFSVVATHLVIDKAKKMFDEITYKPIDSYCIPYKRNSSQRPTVSYEDLLTLAKWRKSVRWYMQKSVPRDLIDKALHVALLSPSACNRQPFEYYIFDEPSLVQKVASIPMGTRGFSQNFPVIIVVVGKLRSYFNERDRHLIYIDAALSSMSFMLALETLGLSSCPINWPDIPSYEKKMAAHLNLAPDERPIMLISVGYPDFEGMVAYSQKKSLDVARFYNNKDPQP